MNNKLTESQSMLDHAAVMNNLTMRMIRDRFEYAPEQIARGVAKYHLGMVAYAEILWRITQDEYRPFSEDDKRCIAQILTEMRRWHVANFGIEPPWVQAIKEAAP